MSAAFRVVLARGSALASSLDDGIGTGSSPSKANTNGNSNSSGGSKDRVFLELFDSLLSKLPLTTDVSEGKACHGRIVRLAAEGDPRVLGGAGPEEGLLVGRLIATLAGMMAYQPSPDEEEMETAAAVGGGCCNAQGECSNRESEEEMWARQLVDKETRIAAEGVVGGLRERFPQRFEDAWVGLAEGGRKALQTPTSAKCLRGN